MAKRNEIIIREDVLENVKSSCRAKFGSDSAFCIHKLLKEFYNTTLPGIDEELHKQIEALGTFPSDNTIARLLGLKKDHTPSETYPNKLLEKLLNRFVNSNRQTHTEGKEDSDKLIENARENLATHSIHNFILDDQFQKVVFDQLSNAHGELYNENLLSQLVADLQRSYKCNGNFNSIGLLADSNGIFGQIPMSSDFVQISYISQVEARQRDSMLKSETELNKTKIKRSILSNQKLSRDYIVNYHFDKIDQLLVLGNPGIGKSTFSRWYCYEWIRQPQLFKSIPIYIELKRLNFNFDGNILSHYIKREYLTTDIPIESLNELLFKAPAMICWLLDGYDELSNEQKQRLSNTLKDINHKCHYILTSRPYGILNTYGLSFTEAIQLDGLDISNINNYIDNFIRKNKHREGKTKKKLLKTIDSNSTLSDFAHNPLMLSFIVVIYLSDDSYNEIFKHIKSRFDLQDVVITWMLEHNQTQLLTPNLFQEAAKIAINLELNKEFEISRFQYEKRDEFIQIFEPLAQKGIGQIVKDENFRFKFYFNSVSFQEYFAAIALRNTITAGAFAYLLKDQYFWNLGGMLAGSVTDMSVLNGLVSICEQDILHSTSKASNYYKYVLLLSECNDTFLNHICDANKLSLIYRSYRICRLESESLIFALGECIFRLYKKLTSRHQACFRNIILGELTYFLNQKEEDEFGYWNENYSHLPGLIEHIELWKNVSFCIDWASLLIGQLNNKPDAQIDTNLDEMLIDIILTYQPEKAVTNPEYVDHLKKIYELLPKQNINARTHIRLYYTDVYLAFDSLPILVQKYQSAKGKAREVAVGNLMTSLFIVALRYMSSNNADMAVDTTVRQTVDILYSYVWEMSKKNHDKHFYSYTDLIYLLSTTLLELGRKEYIEKAMEIMSLDRDLRSSEVELLNKESLFLYFDSLIKDWIPQEGSTRIKHIVMLIQHIPALKNKVAFYRHVIADLVKNYLKEHSETFENYTVPYVIKENNNEGKKAQRNFEIIGSIEPFFELLRGDEHKIYETDKHYFLKKMLKNGFNDTAYFRKHVFRTVFFNEINIYDDLYWDCIISCLNDKEQAIVENALFVCTNDSVYGYSTNLHKLKIVFDIIYTNVQKIKSVNNVDDIMFIVAHSLLMLRKNLVDDDLAAEIINYTGKILKNPLIRKATLDNGISKWFRSEQAAYIMQYYFTNDALYDLNINYSRKCKSNSLAYENLLRDISDAFARSENWQRDREILNSIIGKDLTKKIDALVAVFRFDRSEFEELCIQKPSTNRDQ